MIAKRIPAKKGQGSYKQLAEYITDRHGNGEKASDVRITNDATSDDLDDLIFNVQRVQAGNTRSKANKNFHLMISFNPNDKISVEQIHQIEDEACKALGLDHHQRVSAIHHDTDNLHIHVAINKVDPKTLNNVDPSHGHYKLQSLCAEMEKRYGLEVDKGKSSQEVGGKASDMEVHSGVQSFKGWAKREIKPSLVLALESSKGWGDFHKALSSHGVEIAPRGAGFVLRDINNHDLSMKASDLGRAFSKSSIEAKLGEYQANPQAKQNQGSAKGYKAKPMNNRHEANKLFAEYQKQMRERKAEKQNALKAIRDERFARESAIKRESSRRRGAIKQDLTLGRRTKRRTYQQIGAETAAQLAEVRKEAQEARRVVHESTGTTTWSQWLAQEALAGRDEALQALRGQKHRPQRGDREQRLEGLDEAGVKAGASRVNRSGDVFYGKAVRDRGSEVSVEQAEEGDVAKALSVAAGRYKEGVEVVGDDAFKAAAARIAGEHGVPVTFSDERLEAVRKAVSDAREKGATPRHGKAAERTQAVRDYIEKRNAARDKTSNIFYHREKQEADTGPATYRGQRNIEGGGKVALYERKGEMLVASISPTEAARLKRTKVGATVELTRQGVRQETTRNKGVER
ncbi:TraI/MobA(P) family conjugative relaxase [Modicisalibacter sp. 'Wilcox']|uniref:TraI/MobA(P) family conjugative relaxase n=1 Tax=Modicisalibacter sp. 'Wilcox' TaxID=2679914 RepID=UPI0013D74BFB|nr:TraI/MobA(P) family conjugative relaxase [Modicisalibacter sp. 'Wilcox']